MWPFKKKETQPTPKSATQLHMETLTEGSDVLLQGKMCKVIQNTADCWDDEWLCPYVEVAYWDSNNVYRTKDFSPREALLLLTLVFQEKQHGPV